MDKAEKHGTDIGPVVSSAHLAKGSFPEISEFEFGLTLANHAFQRWMVRCMASAGHPELSALDVLVLHSVFHRDRPKTLADICLVLSIEDTHTVNYAIKKLAKSGLVTEGRKGKEKTVAATEQGAAACMRYREIREALLLRTVTELGFEPEQVHRLAALLRLMSGQYDQAARAATTY
jgi:predicted MarR family transcription regulator